MGSQPSSTNAIAKDKNSISQSNQEVYNDTTSYKGMKTETEVSGKSLKSGKATDQETVASQEKKVPVKFEYQFKA